MTRLLEKIFFIIIVGILVLALGAIIVIVSMFADPEYQAKQIQQEFVNRNYFVEQCLSSERYSREECIILAGKQK